MNMMKMHEAFSASRKSGISGITKAELIGRDVEIRNARNKSLSGMKGKIIDETKNSFVLQTEKGKKNVLKKDADFRFVKEDITIKGEELAKRPEDRIKT